VFATKNVGFRDEWRGENRGLKESLFAAVSEKLLCDLGWRFVIRVGNEDAVRIKLPGKRADFLPLLHPKAARLAWRRSGLAHSVPRHCGANAGRQPIGFSYVSLPMMDPIRSCQIRGIITRSRTAISWRAHFGLLHGIPPISFSI
jgi:hypothetical protein